jgi:hypothetical protein
MNPRGLCRRDRDERLAVILLRSECAWFQDSPARGFKTLLESHGRQDRWDPFRQHRFPGSRTSDEQSVVSTGRTDLTAERLARGPMWRGATGVLKSVLEPQSGASMLQNRFWSSEVWDRCSEIDFGTPMCGIRVPKFILELDVTDRCSEIDFGTLIWGMSASKPISELRYGASVFRN